MSDRKYNQRGYMQGDRDSDQSRNQSRNHPDPKYTDREGPRSPRIMAFGEASKCTACGAKAPANIKHKICPKCNADLRHRRQCTHFDPGAR